MDLSIIIPSLNEETNIISCLQSIAAQAPHGFNAIEIIVVDGGSSDSTCQKVTQFAGERSPKIMLLNSQAGRSKQMNAGAKKATGDVFLFLHADSTLSEKALFYLHTELNAAKENCDYGYFRLAFDSSHPLSAIYSEATKINSIFLHYGDCGIFTKRAFFDLLGGFTDIVLMEDLDFLLKARAKSDPLLIREATVKTSARRFQSNGFLWQQLKNIGLVTLFMAGFDPAFLKKLYT